MLVENLQSLLHGDVPVMSSQEIEKTNFMSFNMEFYMVQLENTKKS